MRVLSCLVVLTTGMAAPALAEPPHTTRIETRPYYGAVVTIEQGVRVYRPIPPTTHMIINPGGSTPLELGMDEGRAYILRPARAATEAPEDH